MAEPVSVQLARCGKTFDDGTRALEPVDFTIKAGETVAVLGPSGCGKTTLLRIIAGLEAPDAGGRVLFGDEDVTAEPIERRNVGMVFQSYALFPNMSVADNIAYGLKVRKVAAAPRAKRLAEMVDMMHLRGLEARRIDQLSGGQKQRVALARALAVRPRVLLLDEPLTALDAKLREELRVEVDSLLRSLAVTAVYVTHDQAEAMALGDRIAVMEKGCIAQVGTPQEVYYSPATRFVADFVGTMNRLAGRRVGDRLEVPGGALPWPHGGRDEQEVLFRPEEVSIVADGAGHLTARVVSAFFLGDHTRLIVDVGSAAPIVVEARERRAFAPGETLRLALDPRALITLDA